MICREEILNVRVFGELCGGRLFAPALICHLIAIEISHRHKKTWILAIPYRSRSKSLNIDSRNTGASERKDPGAIAEGAGSTIPKEARLVRVPAYLRRSKGWWRADPVERRRTAGTRKLFRLIHPHLRHRSPPTVRARCSSDRPTAHHSFNKRSHFCNSRP